MGLNKHQLNALLIFALVLTGFATLILAIYDYSHIATFTATSFMYNLILVIITNLKDE